MNTLFLGQQNSSFYKSISGVLSHLNIGGVISEHSFSKAVEIVEYVKSNNFTHVLMPNPYGNNRRRNCYQQLKKNNIKVIASDRGALPDSWFFDEGFNSDSDSFKKERWDKDISKESEKEISDYLNSLRSTSETLEENGKRVGHEKIRASLGIPEGKKIVFVPLQRPNDTVIKFFAGGVGSFENFIQWIIKVEKVLNEKNNDYVFVLKKHPLEVNYPSLPANKNIGFVPDDVNFNDLIEVSHAVVVINSGVGLISLAFQKPVICAGNAFYAHEGLATQVKNETEMANELANPEGPDSKKILRFYHHLLNNVYSFGSFKNEKVKDGEGYRTITREIYFYELRVLGQTLFKEKRTSYKSTEVDKGGKKKILFVIPLAIIPIYRGNQSRIETIIKQVASNPKNEVHLCVLNRSFKGKASQVYAEEIKKYFNDVNNVTVVKGLEFPGKSFALKLESFLAKKHKKWMGLHSITNYYDSPLKFRRAVRRALESERFDSIVVNYAAQMKTVPEGYSGKVILDTHDYQYAHVKSDQEQNDVKSNINLEKFRKSEIDAICKADTVIAINPMEAKLMESFCKESKVAYIPQFFASHYKLAPKFWIKSYSAVFVGSVANFNVGGINWFLSKVLPCILEKDPHFRLAIVGDVCRIESVKLAASKHSENVFLLGRVDSVAAAYSQSECVIAPILGGAGMKIKVIEALSYGKCVVGTTAACDGIVETSKASILIEDTPELFADAVCKVCSDAELRGNLEEAGMAFFEENYSIAAQKESIDKLFEESI